MNYFVSFDLSVLPHHWHDPRRQHATTSKYFWEWQVIFLYFALACWSCLVFQWQRSRFPCLCFVTCHVRMSSHPNKLALIYSGSVTSLLFSCFISVEVLEIWFQLQLKCNVAASVGATEKTGGDLWAPVPLSLLCTELSLAVSPPLGSWEREKKSDTPKTWNIMFLLAESEAVECSVSGKWGRMKYHGLGLGLLGEGPVQLDGGSFLSVQISVIIVENKIVKKPKPKKKQNKKNFLWNRVERRTRTETSHILIILHSQILTL